MKKRICVLFSAIILCIGALFSMGSCAGDEDLLKEYTVSVTYYFNGGSMAEYTNATELSVRYKPGTPIIEPGTVNNLNAVTLRGWYAEGWYYAELDEEGNLVKDENGLPVPSDKKFDFATERPTESLSLVVKWTRRIKVIFKNLIISGKEFEKQLDPGATLTPPSSAMLNLATITVSGYYWSYDEESGEFSDEIVLDEGISFEELATRWEKTQDIDGDYSVIYIYVKGDKK